MDWMLCLVVQLLSREGTLADRRTALRIPSATAAAAVVGRKTERALPKAAMAVQGILLQSRASRRCTPTVAAGASRGRAAQAMGMETGGRAPRRRSLVKTALEAAEEEGRPILAEQREGPAADRAA